MSTSTFKGTYTGPIQGLLFEDKIERILIPSKKQIELPDCPTTRRLVAVGQFNLTQESQADLVASANSPATPSE